MVEFKRDQAEVTGFIDVPGIFADYGRELSFMEMFGVANDYFYELYRQYYELDENYEIRKNIYNLKMFTKHVQMYPSQHFYRKGAAECLEYIKKHLL